MSPNSWNTDRPDGNQQRYHTFPSSTDAGNGTGWVYPRVYDGPTQTLANTELNLSFDEHDEPAAHMPSEPANAPSSQYGASALTGVSTLYAVDVGGAPGEGSLGSASDIPTTRQGIATNHSQTGESRPRYPCDYPGCTETLSRPKDIGRHKSSVHKQGDLRHYCRLVGKDGCSHKDRFPRKDKLKDHLRQKHKVPDHQLYIQLQDPSEDGLETLMDTAMASENIYTPVAQGGSLSQVTSNHRAHPNTFGIENVRSSYLVTLVPLQPTQEESIMGINPLATTVPSTVDLVQPPSIGSGRNSRSGSCGRQQYSQPTYSQVPPYLGSHIYTDGSSTSYPEVSTLAITQNTAVGRVLKSQHQPRPQADREWSPLDQAPFQRDSTMNVSRRALPQGSQVTSPYTTSPGVGPAEYTGGSHGPAHGMRPAAPFLSLSQQSRHSSGPSSSQCATRDGFSTGLFSSS